MVAAEARMSSTDGIERAHHLGLRETVRRQPAGGIGERYGNHQQHGTDGRQSRDSADAGQRRPISGRIGVFFQNNSTQ